MIDNKDIADLRRNYSLETLDENSVRRNPFEQFALWLNEALNSAVSDPNAMILTTISMEGSPSSRVVLLKGIDEDGFIFYSNYESRKGKELSKNPAASLLFFWKELERQIFISGHVNRIPREVSEQYFRTRPYESKIAAWASEQSSVIPNRKFLEERFNQYKSKYISEVPLPPFWGGYKLIPQSFEFWQGRENRLHDRIFYELNGNKWDIKRLAP